MTSGFDGFKVLLKLPTELLKRLEAYRARNGRTRAEVMRAALDDYLVEREQTEEEVENPVRYVRTRYRAVSGRRSKPKTEVAEQTVETPIEEVQS